MGRNAGNAAFKLAWIRFVLLLTLFWASPSQALDEEVAAINQAIQSQGAQWVAGETSVSRMSPEARRHLLGLVKPQGREEEWTAPLEASLAPKAAALPTGLDWRSYYGASYVTPVRDQGDCGSCWAFATTAAMESKILMADNTPGFDLDLAEQILVSCGTAGDCDAGGWISDASDFLRNTGLPLETCFPYTATNNDCSRACSRWQSYTYHISGYRWIAYGYPTLAALKNALYLYGPVVTTMDVYTDFYNYETGVYSRTTGSYEGGHAILLVGYDDGAQCFIAKNSWGLDWGERGYFRIAYSQLKAPIYLGEYAIAYEGQLPPIPTPPPTPDPPPAPDNPVCGYSLSAYSGAFRYTGGSGRAQVTASASSCSWQATSNASWIQVIGGSNRAGSKTVRFRVLRNLTTDPRTGTLNIAGQTFTVTQAGKALRRVR
ncbi:MAG: hypothetical protein MUF52_07310 [Syntrophobacteraceae bacterium]|jgi:C1A family cysteine protease|nr:hypothetical protein [Syntrophobacteraceae bacterium]